MEETVVMRHTSLFDVIRDLRDDVKTLIKDEIQLAKTELTQKFSRMGKNSLWVGIGAVLGLFGALLLLASIGAVLAYAFVSAGLSSEMAWFLGLLCVSLLVLGTAAILAIKGIKGIKQVSLTPEQTVQNYKEIRAAAGTNPPEEPKVKEPELPKRSPEQIQSEIDVTRLNLEKRMEELSVRMSPAYMGRRFVQNVRAHPIRSSLIGAGTGFVSYLAVKKRMNGNHHD